MSRADHRAYRPVASPTPNQQAADTTDSVKCPDCGVAPGDRHKDGCDEGGWPMFSEAEVWSVRAPRNARRYVPPKSLVRSKWMRADWYDHATMPGFRFHLCLGRGPSLWLKIGRLDMAFHRYV